MKSEFTSRAQALKPSPTMAMANRARELKAQGHDVVSLTVGEPDWPTFQVASKAGMKAIENNLTKYTAAAGIPELRAAIAQQVYEELSIKYSVSEVVVGSGAKFIIYSLLQIMIEAGDEVIVPAPYWVSYPSMVELAGGTAKIIDCGVDVNFKLTARVLEKQITNKTKALILCSPSNPTGLMYTAQELQELALVIKKHPQLKVISDDIYNKLIFMDSQNSARTTVAPHLLNVAPELRSQVFIVNGASKTYAMTGWRVGWVLAEEKWTKVLSDFMSQTTSNVTSISQYATLAAIQSGAEELGQVLNRLEIKKNHFLKIFKSLNMIKVIPPDGAFYFWCDISKCLNRKIQLNGNLISISDSRHLAEIWLDKYLVAAVPGLEFGMDGFIRLSIATSEQDLQKAFERLQRFESDLI